MKISWSAAALLLSVAVVLYTDVSRFVDPVGEKYVPVMPPGSADLYVPFNGARALLKGLDPYHHDDRSLFDPWQREEAIGGVHFRQFYPPSHLLLYVPLALVSRGDPRVAARIWFHCNLLSLAALAFLVALLASSLVPESTSRLLLAMPILLVLALNVGVLLALERGQSDLFGALLCWLAVTLALRRRFGVAMFLAVTAMLIKGYALLFACGLGLLGLQMPSSERALWRRPWFATVAGTLAALVVFLAPVAKYLPDAITTTRFRTQMFQSTWINHSFRNLAYNLSPAWADRGRILLTVLALFSTAAAWLWARRTLRRPDATAADQTLALAAFAVAALGTMIGYSALSCSYNLVMILPGFLIFLFGQERLTQLTGWPAAVPGVALLFVGGLLLSFRASETVSTTSFGIVLLLGLVGAVSLRTLARR